MDQLFEDSEDEDGGLGTAVPNPTEADVAERERKVEFEVALYQSDRRVSSNSNPLEWWKAKCTVMPILSQLVKRLFCIPATSVPSERVFSAAGHLISAKRNALGEEIVDILLFLQQNMH